MEYNLDVDSGISFADDISNIAKYLFLMLAFQNEPKLYYSLSITCKKIFHIEKNVQIKYSLLESKTQNTISKSKPYFQCTSTENQAKIRNLECFLKSNSELEDLEPQLLLNYKGFFYISSQNVLKEPLIDEKNKENCMTMYYSSGPNTERLIDISLVTSKKNVKKHVDIFSLYLDSNLKDYIFQLLVYQNDTTTFYNLSFSSKHYHDISRCVLVEYSILHLCNLISNAKTYFQWCKLQGNPTLSMIFYESVAKGYSELLQLLIRNWFMNNFDQELMNKCMWAATLNKYIDCLKILIENGGNVKENLLKRCYGGNKQIFNLLEFTFYSQMKK